MVQSLTALFAMSVFIEGFIEFFISDPNTVQPWLKYVGLVIGVGICLAYRLDVFAILGIISPIVSISNYIGCVLTGVIIGRGSNYLNDFIATFKASTTVSVQAQNVETTTATVAQQ